jgi:hypothetical protein
MKGKDKAVISTIGSKASEALKISGKTMDDTDALKKKIKALATDIMIGGLIIIFTALFYDIIAQLSLHHHSEGFGADQITLLIIGIIITLWGLFRR